MVLNWHHSRLDLYWIQSDVNLTPEFLQCRKIFNMGGAQTIASEASRPQALVRGDQGGPGGAGPLAGVARGSAPLPKKFCILRAKYA